MIVILILNIHLQVYYEISKITTHFPGDEGNNPSKHKQCTEDEESLRIKMIWLGTTSIGVSKGSTRHLPYAVIDSGAEREIIGGVG